MNTAFVALGANLGDPAATVKAAFAALANLPDSRIVHCSSLYRTAPVGITEQPEFVNAVAELPGGLQIRVTKDGIDAEGGSILGLMMLGAAKGDQISIAVSGPGAEQALATLADLVKGGFGEE